jgi:hypothetical protein
LEAQPPHAAKSPIENNSDSPTTTREKGRRMNSLSSFIVVALNYQQQQQPDKCILEDREPVATFGTPGVEGTFALLPPKPIFTVMSIVVRADACLSTESIGGFSTNLLCSVYRQTASSCSFCLCVDAKDSSKFCKCCWDHRLHALSCVVRISTINNGSGL